MMRSTAHEASYTSEFSNTCIVRVRFVDNNGLFSKKTYNYFYSTSLNPEVGGWLTVIVGGECKHVYVEAIVNTKSTDIALKSIYGKCRAELCNDLNTKYAKAIAQLKMEDAMAFGASIHSQINAQCNNGFIIDYKTLQSIDDRCLEILSNKTSPKENIMHPFKLITKTFVTSDEVGQDVDVSKLSDDQIFDLIAKAEAEITKLEAIKTKPKKLQQRIDDLQAGITQITAYLDAKA